MISQEAIQKILDNNNPEFLEALAQRSHRLTRQHFGRTISLYTPLYLANYCDNGCLYCGFNAQRSQKRLKLSGVEMHAEMAHIASLGIKHILLLTGESRRHTPVEFILDAVLAARQYFSCISLEIYSLETEEYRVLFEAGVDGVTLYQETYNRSRYKQLHPSGKKADYDYRYSAPERMSRAGIRLISMGILLGLWDFAEDVFHLFNHLSDLERSYPAVEFSLSFPRLIPPENGGVEYFKTVDQVLIKLICLTRILFPRVGISLSTREDSRLRNHAVRLGITRMSAASRTTVGGYTGEGGQDTQFEVSDTRSVSEMVTMLKETDYDPVFTDWRRIENSEYKLFEGTDVDN